MNPGFAVHVEACTAPPVNRAEILRYAGAPEAGPELQALLEDCLAELPGKLSYRLCWQAQPLWEADGGLELGYARTVSRDLREHLRGCTQTVLFAATLGLELDRMIVRAGRASPARALLLQAIGAERIESLCDRFESELRRKVLAAGGFTVPRFSPGYGDLPLELQRDIFRALDCPRRIGLTLNESLLMSPGKSVTALIGIGGCESFEL